MFFTVIEIALVLLLVGGTVLTEVESFGWATVVLLATVAGAQFFHVVPLLEWVSAHVLDSLWLVLGYLALGVGWSFVKWFSFLLGFRDQYRELKAAFLDRQKELVSITGRKNELADQSEEERMKAFHRSIAFETYRGQRLTDKPKASKNKSRIVAWMAYWPLSLVGTLLNDPVRRLFNWLFSGFKALYQQMADAIFRNDKELQ